MLCDWPGCAAPACAPGRFVLSRHAFPAGVAVAPAPVVVVLRNLAVGIGFGVAWPVSAFPLCR